MTRAKEPDVGSLDASFLHGLAEDGALDSKAMAELFSELERDLDKERGVAAWLRNQSTAARLGLGLGFSFGVVLAVGLFLPRPDLSMLPTWRVVTVLSSLALLFAASVWFGLRPLHRPTVPDWLEPGLLGAALLGMVALALLPLADPMPDDHSGWMHALPCMFGGLLFGVPAYLLIRLLDRGGRQLSAFLAAAAAALSANAALAMHCHNDSVVHLLKGHASLGVLFVGVVAAWRWVMTRLEGRRADK